MSKESKIQDELSSSMTGGRLRRYAKVTSAMGGLAARLAGLHQAGRRLAGGVPGMLRLGSGGTRAARGALVPGQRLTGSVWTT